MPAGNLHLAFSRFVSPLQGLMFFWPMNPGRCPGLLSCAPLGLGKESLQKDSASAGKRFRVQSASRFYEPNSSTDDDGF